jgi:aminoglycoside phosphotransferase (APT) family kinase protein
LLYLARQNNIEGVVRMPDETFDVLKELAEIKEHRELQRRKYYRKSKLEKYRAELVALKMSGASAQDLVVWLRTKHRLKMHRSSVDRYLNGLPETKVCISNQE